MRKLSILIAVNSFLHYVFAPLCDHFLHYFLTEARNYRNNVMLQFRSPLMECDGFWMKRNQYTFSVAFLSVFFQVSLLFHESSRIFH